jgi:hypothetical protein
MGIGSGLLAGLFSSKRWPNPLIEKANLDKSD